MWSNMAGSFSIDAEGLVKGMAKLQDRFDAAVHMKMQQYASDLQSYAQTHARWTNRTGEARRRLKGSYQATHNGYRLTIAHGVNYGIWLELANEKRYAIINETVEVVGQQKIMPNWQKFLDKI